MPDTQFAETFKKDEDISGNRFVQPPHVGKISAAILSGVVPSEKEIGDSFPFIRMSKKKKALLVKDAALDERRPTDWVMTLVRQRLRKLGVLPPRSKKKGTESSNQ